MVYFRILVSVFACLSATLVFAQEPTQVTLPASIPTEASEMPSDVIQNAVDLTNDILSFVPSQNSQKMVQAFSKHGVNPVAMTVHFHYQPYEGETKDESELHWIKVTFIDDASYTPIYIAESKKRFMVDGEFPNEPDKIQAFQAFENQFRQTPESSFYIGFATSTTGQVSPMLVVFENIWGFDQGIVSIENGQIIRLAQWKKPRFEGRTDRSLWRGVALEWDAAQTVWKTSTLLNSPSDTEETSKN